MQSPEPLTPERQAIHSALLRVERRLRLNRTLHAVALVAGLALLGLIGWRMLSWLGDAAPAASALVVLGVLLGAIFLLALLAQSLYRSTVGVSRAASEADARARLHNELATAYWFMQAPLPSEAPGLGAKQLSVATDWIGAQLQRAARTARTLEPARLVPLRLPRGVTAGLLAGLLLLGVTWTAPPLAPAYSRSAQAVETPERAQVRELRELVEALPQGDAARRLQAALSTLESGSASPQERRQALAQAQDAVDQIRLNAAASREGLQRLSEMLAGQEGLEEVAQALAQGDAKRAAELLAKVESGQRAAGSGNAPDPSETVGEPPLDQGLQALTDAMAEPQGGRPTSETLQMTVDRLEQIARELSAANYVNEAWREVKGPQLQAARGTSMTAGRFDQQQSTGASNPSPSTGDTPMGGGTMFRSAAVAQGPGTEEQEGGTRAGDAIGDAPPDPVLGEAGERLDAQLKQQGLAGQEEQVSDEEDQAWFYAESQKRAARTAWRDVPARARFAEADAGTAGGISIRHRQIVKDYFMNRREAAQ